MPEATIRFKTCYIGPILDGTKTVTARKYRPPITVGHTAIASVFNRPFAILKILSCDLVPVTQLDPQHRRGVEAMYPGTADVWLVRFELVAPLGKWLVEARQRADVHESLPAHEHTKIRSTESPDTGATARGSTDH